MKVTIKAADIARTDFSSASEIWIDGPDTAPDAGDTAEGLCLWRGQPVVTHDMLSEGTHEQNVRRIWLTFAGAMGRSDLLVIEQMLRERLAAQQLEGEFYPAHHADSLAAK